MIILILALLFTTVVITLFGMQVSSVMFEFEPSKYITIVLFILIIITAIVSIVQTFNIIAFCMRNNLF